MHAEENGFYWLAKAAGIPQKYEPDQDKETCLTYFADHCRITEQEAKKIIFDLKVHRGGLTYRAKWNETCESMKPRWKAEAQAAISLLEKL